MIIEFSWKNELFSLSLFFLVPPYCQCFKIRTLPSRKYSEVYYAAPCRRDEKHFLATGQLSVYKLRASFPKQQRKKVHHKRRFPADRITVVQAIWPLLPKCVHIVSFIKLLNILSELGFM